MQRKKIVHLISSLKIGGAESLLVDLILGLGFKDYEHHVIYFHHGPHVERLRAYKVPVYRIHGAFCLYDPIFFWHLWRELKKINPDVIHTALWAANFAGRIMGALLRIPVLNVVHLGVNLDGRVRNMLDAATFQLATRVVAVSSCVQRSLTKKTWIPISRITTIANGIHAPTIVERAVLQNCSRKDFGIDESAVVIGAVGRFVPRKNFMVLINAFADVYAEHKNAHLMLIGLGEQEAALRAQVAALHLHDAVTFVVGKSAYGYYPLFDCFVLPSAQEGLSIAMLEALCFSLPCVVTDHEVITHDYNGLVIPAGNRAALANAIRALVMDAEKRQRLGKQAYQLVRETFSLERMVTAYKNLFEQCGPI